MKAGRLALGIVVLAVLLVAARFVTTRDGGEAHEGKVVLTLSALSSPAITEAVRQYRAVRPDVEIRVSYASLDAYQAATRTRIAGGNPPDIIAVWPGNGNPMAVHQIGPLGALADLSHEPWAGEIPQGAKPLLGVDGRVLMWSPGSTVIGAIYNRALFRQAGVEVPRTWDELLAVCSRLRANGIVPIALGNQTLWVSQLVDYAIAASTAYVDNPALAADMRAGHATFATSGWRETLQRYVELSTRGCYAASPNGTTLERQESLLATGKAAMIVQVAPTMETVRAAAPDGEFGMFPFPANDRPEDLRVAAGISLGLGVSAKSPHQAEARRFLAFLARPEIRAVFNQKGYNVPLDPSSQDGLAPYLKPFVPYFERGDTVPFMDQLWPNADVQQEHFAVAQDLLAHRTSIDDALRRLDAAYARR